MNSPLSKWIEHHKSSLNTISTFTRWPTFFILNIFLSKRKKINIHVNPQFVFMSTMLSIFFPRQTWKCCSYFLCGFRCCQCSTQNYFIIFFLLFSLSDIINLYNLFSCKSGFSLNFINACWLLRFPLLKSLFFSFTRNFFNVWRRRRSFNLIKSNNQIFSFSLPFRLSKFRFTIYKVNKASKKKREKSSAKRERKATKTLAIVLGKHINPISLHYLCECLKVWSLQVHRLANILDKLFIC